MKKRIISLILVIVTFVLALVGCAYNIAGADLGKYASFNKDEFLAALANIKVKGGDFGDDINMREKKVLDSLYASLASKSGTELKKDGKVGEHDNFYYCYYVEYVNTKGETVLVPTYMDTASAIKIQLGLKDDGAYTGDLKKLVANKINSEGFTFTADNAYDPITSGKSSEKAAYGDYAVISYTVKYKLADATEYTEQSAAKALVILKENNPIHRALLSEDATIGSVVKVGGSATFDIDIAQNDSFEVDNVTFNKDTAFATVGENNAVDKMKLIDAKIDYVVKGTSILDKEFGEDEVSGKSTLKDFYGHSTEVNNSDITYHVFAYRYTEVYTLNAENIIELLEAEKFSLNTAVNMYLNGKGLKNASEEDKQAALNAIVIDGVTPDEGSSAYETLASDIVDALYDVYTKNSAYETAVTNYSSGVANNQDNVEELKTARDNAEKALNEAKKTRDDLVNKLISVSGMNDILVAGYKDLKYYEKQEAYNKDIKQQAAEEVYKLIKSMVTVTSVPKKAVNEAYDMLINNYKYDYYNGDYAVPDEEGNTITNYTYYSKNGGFNIYLKDQVAGDSKFNTGDDVTIETVSQAKKALRAYAESTVVPVVQYTFIAQQFGLEYTNKQFRQYKKDTSNGYAYSEIYYGEANIRNALQFEQLMNEFLTFEKVPNANDSKYEGYKYENKYVKITVN